MANLITGFLHPVEQTNILPHDAAQPMRLPAEASGQLKERPA